MDRILVMPLVCVVALPQCTAGIYQRRCTLEAPEQFCVEHFLRACFQPLARTIFVEPHRDWTAAEPLRFCFSGSTEWCCVCSPRFRGTRRMPTMTHPLGYVPG